ncbi:MAG: hypothetical protein IJT23_05215 [Clostridia bacterium]|nr:hypothetical protein [Clostridia bacterium]
MKSKKLISLLAVLAMCIELISVPAMAEDTVVNVSSQAELQAALDNFTAGTTIQLAENVDYGVVYLRPSETNPATKTIDWVGNDYRYESLSVFEDMTIKGATGSVIDAIKIEGGVYWDTEHSQSSTYPKMLSLIELKNVVIDGVTFTGDVTPDADNFQNILSFRGGNIKVDGLTVQNCTVNSINNRVMLMHKEGSTTYENKYQYANDDTEYTFIPSLANITVKNCTFNGGLRLLELRETNNLTIEGNTINNTAQHNILLPANTGCTYSGIIKIVGNTSNGITSERFIRATAMGNSEVIVEDNAVTNYTSTDKNFVKIDGVTSGGTYSIENNTFDGRDTELKVSTGMYELFATDWTTDTDAGYYTDTTDNTDYGMMRYLFKVETDDDVTEYGIKYIKTSAIGDGISSAEAEEGTVVKKEENVTVFHGDIVKIPQGTSTDGSYYAVGYVKTSNDEVKWSPIKSNKINWLRKFTDYTPGGDK